MPPGFRIAHVQKGSPAAKAGVKAGDVLLKINNAFFYDILDYRYLCAGPKVFLEFYTKKGQYSKVTVKKGYDQDPGLEFWPPTIGPVRRCKNHCLFCFIDQQPAGLRPSLYEKDDDYRLSFFHGNYITLTNTGAADIKRIVRRGLSPLYVSIHSTVPAIRRKLMGNRAAGGIREQLKALVAGGIELHGQVVVCPGINDGEALKKTVDDLAPLYPGLKTLALVPVGLTRYRRKLFPQRPVGPDEARGIVETYTAVQERLQKRCGSPFVYLADEFYLLAGKPLPPHEHYGGYQQLENGVGLGRMFLNELAVWESTALPSLDREMAVSLVTGRSGAVFLQPVQEALQKIKGLQVMLHVLPNIFWGGNVSVAGLLTGSDLLAGLQGKKLGEAVFIPEVMLKEGTRLFLDNMSLNVLAARLKTPVVPVGGLAEISKYLVKKGARNGLKDGEDPVVCAACGPCRPPQRGKINPF